MNRVLKTKRFNKTYRGRLTKRRIEKMRKKNMVIVAMIFISITIGYVSHIVVATNRIYINNDTITTSPFVELTRTEENTSPPQTGVRTIMIETVEEQIRRIAKEENFQWTDYLVRLAKCESTLNPKATNINRNGTIDRGLFQWNDKLPPLGGISDDCAFSVDCSTRATINAINKGYQQRWMCDRII